MKGHDLGSGQEISPLSRQVAGNTASRKASSQVVARGSAAEILRLQRLAGNRAVSGMLDRAEADGTAHLPIQRLMFAEGKDMTGKVLTPQPIRQGKGPKTNLKWNKGGGQSGKGKYNTGFWKLEDDPGLELHVHFGDGGGLSASGGIAHHFKRGEVQKGSAGNGDLQKTFGSTVVTAWDKDSYTIK